MPYYHCTKCHHEFEGIDGNPKCDWCGAPSFVLENQTPLEKMVEDIDKVGVDKWFNVVHNTGND